MLHALHACVVTSYVDTKDQPSEIVYEMDTTFGRTIQIQATIQAIKHPGDPLLHR